MHHRRSSLVVASLCVLGACAAVSARSDLAHPWTDVGVRAASHVTLDLRQAVPGEPLVTVVPIEGVPYVLDLRPHSVRADGYRVLAQVADGSLVEVEPGPVRTLRGSLGGFPNSFVAGSLLRDGLHARILAPNGNEYWLEPLSRFVPGAGPNDHVLYDGADVEPTGLGCGTSEQLRIDDPGVPGAGGAAAGGGGVCTTELACDADNEYYQDHGSSVSQTEARINSVINAMNLQYESEVNITHVITTIIVRTSEPDPYTHKNASNLLNQFRNHWNANHGGVQRDVAQLFTGKNLSGSTIGIAWVGAVCTSFGYSVVESDWSSNFACVTDLSAHELGHNWGADHCSCSGWTMNPGITCANRFHPTFTIPEIEAHRDSRTCLSCGPGPVCGDGNCDPGENPCNCPSDCGTPPGTETNCTDGVDDDCDGQTDCDDADCGGDPACDTPEGSAIVDCITYTTRGGPQQNKHLDVTVTIVDAAGNPISGASVTMTLSGGGTFNFGGTTDSNGDVTFTLINAASGCYTSDVTGVSGPGLTFDGSEPPNGFQKGSDSIPDADCRIGSDPCGSG